MALVRRVLPAQRVLEGSGSGRVYFGRGWRSGGSSRRLSRRLFFALRGGDDLISSDIAYEDSRPQTSQSCRQKP